jgi:predicted HicB family RNase H-like nuclease
MKDDRLQVRINAKLKEKADRLAKRQGISLSSLIAQLLTTAVEADQFARQGAHQEVDQV